MTQTAERHNPTRDNSQLEHSEAHEASSSSLQPPTDTASDNDNGEKPVREKLKKTSIASIPKDSSALSRSDGKETEENGLRITDNEHDVPVSGEAAFTNIEQRGRPERKRSLNRLGGAEGRENSTGSGQVESSLEHARKRSRDVRVGDRLKDGSRIKAAPESPLREAADESMEKSTEERYDDVNEIGTPLSGQDDTDQKMDEPVFSPRKKRSRDQFETETQREQKIAATDETKARRRSEEEERQDASRAEYTSPTVGEAASQNGHTVTPESPRRPKAETVAPKIAPSSGFSNTSAISPFGTLGGAQFHPKDTSSRSDDSTSQPTQTSASAFASSGFAALARSTTSPFGALGSSSSNSTPFATNKPDQEVSQSSFGGLIAANAENPVLSGFSAASKGFGTTSPSTFGSSGASGFGAIGSSGFGGGGFGGGLSGGPRLKSFAAPTGDVQWGAGGGPIKPIKSPPGEDGPDENSEDDSDADGEESGDAAGETDGRFHQKEVDTGEQGEETVFSNQGKLFFFDGKAWGERGFGIFKFNVTQKSEDDRSGRFIMRVHQTYRVILNTPVFKQMSIGDSKGKEPPGKAISFAVVENGKPVPYMLRMGKEEDAKSLFREVRNFQDTL